MEKKCTICKEIKNITEYGKDKSRSSGYNPTCKKCKTELARKYRKSNPEKTRVKQRKKEQRRYQKNKEKEKQRVKEYRKNNPDKVKEWTKVSYNKNKQKVDFRINAAMGTGIYRAIREMKNGRHWESLVGYTLAELMAHLESKFDEHMNWDNYGSYWHIDHICPKSWFLVESTEDEAFKKCWALDNLQPLEASKNMSKRNFWEG